MAANIPTIPTLVTPGDLADELQSFIRHLRAQNVSPNTVYAYVGAVVSLRASISCETATRPTSGASSASTSSVGRSRCSPKYKPATAHQRYRGAQRFFHWYQSVDDSETFRSPMAKLRPPKLDEYLPTVLTIDQLKALLVGTAGRTFEDRRDAALLRMFFDTGRPAGGDRRTSGGPPKSATSTSRPDRFASSARDAASGMPSCRPRRSKPWRRTSASGGRIPTPTSHGFGSAGRAD